MLGEIPMERDLAPFDMAKTSWKKQPSELVGNPPQTKNKLGNKTTSKKIVFKWLHHHMPWTSFLFSTNNHQGQSRSLLAVDFPVAQPTICSQLSWKTACFEFHDSLFPNSDPSISIFPTWDQMQQRPSPMRVETFVRGHGFTLVITAQWRPSQRNPQDQRGWFQCKCVLEVV